LQFDWPRAQTILEYGQQIDPADPIVKGELALVNGYVDLNLAIGPQMAVGEHLRDRVVRSWREFDQAASLLPNAPDAHLGLARLYVYSFRDLDKAIEEWNKAEQRHYKLSPREIEQEADGFRLRAQKKFADSHDRAVAQEDLARARDLYQSIKDYDDVPQRLRLVAEQDSAMQPPPLIAALPVRTARPKAVASKSARQARQARQQRRSQAWQSPKAGKRRKS
jgi:tetratricopeptide (TPR) repeat protein